jgi:hypothetical protein
MEGVATYRAILVMAQGVTSMQHATPPLALTDDQLATVLRAAEPLPPRDRTAFFAAVAQVLAGQAVLGDGIVGRTCRELQRLMTSPPEVPRHQPRWSSRRRNAVRQERHSSAARRVIRVS